jgi:hypothetical protein
VKIPKWLKWRPKKESSLSPTEALKEVRRHTDQLLKQQEIKQRTGQADKKTD